MHSTHALAPAPVPASATHSDRAIGLLQFLHEHPFEELAAYQPYLIVCALGAQDLLRYSVLQRCSGILPFRTATVRCYQCGALQGNTAGMYTPYIFACADCDSVGYSAAWMRWSGILGQLCNHVEPHSECEENHHDYNAIE